MINKRKKILMSLLGGIIFILTWTLLSGHENVEFCDKNKANCLNHNKSPNSRYLLYDVNPPEGFNLRRDVYIRMAVFAHNLKHSKNNKLTDFKLVLPPWTNIYHWDRKEQSEYYPWSHFFDLTSLQKFAPVIEIHQFFNEVGTNYKKVNIDEVYVLQHFEDMFETKNFDERMSIAKCNEKSRVRFYDYINLTSDNVKCLSFHGHTSQLTNILTKTNSRLVMFDHAEVPLHDRYGDELYWAARRSMRFNNDLRKIANRYREKYLNSNDVSDNIIIPENWQEEKSHRKAKGGPYISVHLRRRDFLWGRPAQVPSIEGAALQIKNLLKQYELENVFVATDAPKEEFQELKQLLSADGYSVFKFDDSNMNLCDGRVAIIDQIICSHARYFIGTHESTFSFRIQEEREIMGFPARTTFNRLCGDGPSKCEKPSVWKIVY